MSEHPILFNAEMVRAILEGRKTQTRRPIKLNASGRIQLHGKQWHPDDPNAVLGCPYGQPGDILWVRETWQVFQLDEDGECYGACSKIPKTKPHNVSLARAADPLTGVIEGPWRPSIHMPRWAAHIFLRVKSVRVQRVQDITEDDAMAEGFPNPEGTNRDYTDRARYWFKTLWDSINAKRGFGWHADPWVWAIEFELVEDNK